MDAAALWSLLAVLLGGRVGLGFVGVATHHGHVGLVTATLCGLLTLWTRRALLWRWRHRSARPGWWTTIVHALSGGARAFFEALAVPVAAYYWAHAGVVLPSPFRFAVALLVVGLASWVLHRAGFSWHELRAVPSRKRAKEAFGVVWRPWSAHVAWLTLTLAWLPPQGDVQRLLHERYGEQDADFDSFQWVDEPFDGFRTALSNARGLMLVSSAEALADVQLLHVALSHEGVPVRVASTYDLSDTAAVAEAQLTVWQKWAVWSVVHAGAARSIEVADLRGEPESAMAAWPLLSRIQRAITNRQQTGQWRGVGRSSVELQHEPERVQLTVDDGVLRALVAERTVELDLGRVPSAETLGANLVYRSSPPPRPGAVVPWAVDRLRAVSWIGSERMQWLKGWVFRASEQLEELQQEVVGIDPDEVIAEQIGDVLGSLPLARSGEIPGWPPQPLQPLFKVPMAGEGRWVSLAEDLLAPAYDGAGSPFVFTFIRTDPERAYIQTSVTLWDPRRVELHVVAGTEEPKSATGEQGTGTIPREPEVLQRVVGAFNGAFQAVHGQYGMMEERRVQLPPKPYAATVLTYDDGQAGFGTWPADGIIGDDVVSLRQNLTPLVQDGLVNPYRRTWWGGVPEGWTEESRTVRSGLCLTTEGFLAYFYSPGITPDGLSQAMTIARCDYGIHLDMNAGHTGFEFYRVAPETELPKLERRLDSLWEARGRVDGVEGYTFLARLMVRKMPLMNFPRYIHVTSRDFFYLTRRELLPGAPLPGTAGDAEDDARWRLLDIGGVAWPHAGAIARLRASDDDGVERAFLITRLDPKQLQWVGDGAIAEVGLQIPSGAGPEDPSDQTVLWFSQRRFVIAASNPGAAQRVAVGAAVRPQRPEAVLCVDAFGMLTLVAPDEPAEHGVSESLLSRIGCGQRMYFETRARVLAGESLAGARERSDATWFVRSALAGAKRVLSETPVVPPQDWAYVQQRPVQYVSPDATGSAQR